jgi:methionyl-tRNA formyltransferase
MAKIIFMGTPEFSVPILEALLHKHTVTAVVTQPDRPAGRGKTVQESLIKQMALVHDLPVLQPEKIGRKAATEELHQYEADAYVVAAFGQILPQKVLDIPPYGSINVHASLLPRWRGAAPIQAAIRAGDAETGVTIMKMDAGLDTGPMLRARAIPIEPDETGASLHDKLSALGAELLIETLDAYFAGEIEPQPQPEDGVTYAPRIEKAEGRIDWTQPAEVIERLVRAFTPWPGTSTTWNGRTLRIISGAAGSAPPMARVPPPGKVIDVREASGISELHSFAGYWAIGTGENGVYYPATVQLEGRKVVSMDDFVRGYPEMVGSRLGDS